MCEICDRHYQPEIDDANREFLEKVRTKVRELNMAVRCKFQLTKISKVAWNKDQRIFEFNAIMDYATPENERFSKYTPSGTFVMTVENPRVFEQFKLGKNYYFDITEEPEANTE